MARNKTGIVELDEMLRGGFMDKDAVMVAGSAGTGKTTLGLEYLVNGATQLGERAAGSADRSAMDPKHDRSSAGSDFRRAPHRPSGPLQRPDRAFPTTHLRQQCPHSFPCVSR